MARNFDVVVIGAGPGGYTAAQKAVQHGLSAALVEAGKIGGTCVNRGCIPTKALLHASNMFHMMQNCDVFGVSTDFIAFDFGKMQKYKKEAVLKYREGIEAGFQLQNVEIIHGTAILRRDRSVEVELADGGREFIQGNAVIFATGASPVMNDIPGAGLGGVWDSDRLLAGENWNFDRLTIMGGGVIAVEFATIFNNLCSSVTIVEKEKHLMAPMDDVMSAELEQELRRKGIQVYCGATVTEIMEEEGSLSCVIMPGDGSSPFKTRAGQVLMAIGRRPDVGRLFGRDISLKMQDGKIAVNNDFETSEPGVFAIGDVSARTQLAHVAAAQGTYVVEKLAGKPHSVKLEVVPKGMYVSLPIVPNCIYTDPEIATVGITEENAGKCKLKVRCGHFSMRENGKSIISQGNGHDREIATAIANGLTAREMSFAMRAQPTYNEGIGAAIEDAMEIGQCKEVHLTGIGKRGNM